MTNELLRKNAETLQYGILQKLQKESERGNLWIWKTLKQTNAEHDPDPGRCDADTEGRQSKASGAEAEMARMENDLKAKLLEIQR